MNVWTLLQSKLTKNWYVATDTTKPTDKMLVVNVVEKDTYDSVVKQLTACKHQRDAEIAKHGDDHYWQSKHDQYEKELSEIK